MSPEASSNATKKNFKIGEKRRMLFNWWGKPRQSLSYE